ncbi:MAG: CDP-glycerol glycerophosphotransferase family protein [Ruminococcus sp.]|jgi:CDP-glycerol glycerophosphotransferase
MKKKLASFLKYCKPVYMIYYYLGTCFFNIIRFFVRTDDRLILFNSFGGKFFNDSPKAVYDQMIRDSRFSDCRFVWAFQRPEEYDLPRGEKIKTDTMRYFVTALKARCWVTNSSLERGLGIRGKHTYFVNTWHGTPLKKMGSDLGEENSSFKSKNSWNMDLFTTQSSYESEIFTRVFQLKPRICQITGLPRNDELCHVTEERRREIRERLGLEECNRVILYAPTFREYEKNSARECIFAPPVSWDRWQEVLGNNTVILVRAHYEALQAMNLDWEERVRDMSGYPSLNELMIASDVLLSDYSSVFFDYSILEKPMVCFAYDYDQYQKKRGMYFDIRQWLDWGEDQEAVLTILKNLENEKFLRRSVEKTRVFKARFVEKSGHGVEEVLSRIHKNCFY